MTATIALPPRLDFVAATQLGEDLRRLRGQPVTIDCADVSMLGAAALEVLVSAAGSWRRDGVALVCAGPSREFLSDLATMGATGALPLGNAG
jgi:chemotaxis protein CheX